jgi:hypothetical protein
MNDLIKAMVLGLVRNAAMAVGGWLLTKGYLDASSVTGVEGSLCCLGAAAFTIYDKMKVHSQIQGASK